MVKNLVPAVSIVLLLSSCASFKPLNFTSNKQLSAAAPTSKAKFIDDISVTPQVTNDKTEVKPQPQVALSAAKGSNIVETPAQTQGEDELAKLMAIRSAAEIKARLDNANTVENASAVQLKYAILMNTEVESLPNKILLENVDEWYGVRYRSGGNTKSGVDCSGFTVAIYLAVYDISLPRVSREQYRISRKISTTELREGDLVFFNTNGSGVSHVGVYLGNDKFIHASVSRGVMVSGLYEPYYLKRFYGAGRIDDKQMISAKN